MNLYKNLQELEANLFGGGASIYFERARYNSGYYACVDFPLGYSAHYNYFGRKSVYEEIDTANSPGDLDAMNASAKLFEFAEDHPEFLFAQGETLEECLDKLDKRAALWNKLPYDEQKALLDQFVLFEANVL